MGFYHSKIQKQNAKDLRNNSTDAEKLLWKHLQKSQLNGLKFRRQQPIGKYIVDFLCCSEKIIIELDGGQHNDDFKIEYDIKRDKFLQNEGYEVIRIWNNDIYGNIEGVMEYLNNITKNHPPLTPPLKGGEQDSTSHLIQDRGQGGGCITVQCPAKINLTLKVTGKRPDGFHNIESVMQTISLYDYLTISIEPADETEIILSGNSTEIPYNEKNLVYKAVKLFPMTPHRVKIYIEKNIPVSAGLAGGSTDCAGTLFGLNELLGKPLSREELHKLCAQLGSDLNFCLEGGRQMTKGRGEILEQLPFEKFKVSLIKPDALGISAKEAYTKFSDKKSSLNREDLGGLQHSIPTPTLPDKGGSVFLNDLEWAVIDDYQQLQTIKKLYPKSMMSGSGSTYFIIDDEFEPLGGYTVYNDLKAIPYGVKVYK